GLLTPPLKLFRKYKGQLVEADLRLDGQIAFQGTVYPSCSQAGEVARAHITGQRKNTNGWLFWQYRDETGKRRCLDDASKRFTKTKSGGPDQHEPDSLRSRFWETLLSRPKVKSTRHANIAPGEFSGISAGSGVRGLPFVYAVQKK